MPGNDVPAGHHNDTKLARPRQRHKTHLPAIAAYIREEQDRDQNVTRKNTPISPAGQHRPLSIYRGIEPKLLVLTPEMTAEEYASLVRKIAERVSPRHPHLRIIVEPLSGD